jgi:hypothetical protein
LISHDPLLPGFHPLLRGAVADWLRIVAQR